MFCVCSKLSTGLTSRWGWWISAPPFRSVSSSWGWSSRSFRDWPKFRADWNNARRLQGPRWVSLIWSSTRLCKSSEILFWSDPSRLAACCCKFLTMTTHSGLRGRDEVTFLRRRCHEAHGFSFLTNLTSNSFHIAVITQISLLFTALLSNTS